MNRIKLLCGAAVMAGAFMSVTAPTAFAQTAAEEDDSSNDQIVVTGTRRAARSAADTPAPVDVIGSEELLNQADSDLADIIRTSVPSFNVNTQPISDAATLIRPANLRGLPPDNTLVLVNNKRRHRAAVISFLGGGLSDGAQGADISVIPAISLSRVEVLRDGAASQYGSDAIAGVLNFILRDSPDGGQLEAEWGQTYEGDGAAWSVAGNIGMPLGPNGFLNVSAEYGESDATSRSVQRTDAAQLIAAGNTDVQNPAQIWGSPNVDEDFTIFANSAIELGEAAELYAFGNLSGRTVENGFFYRNPTNRAGVYQGPTVDPATGLPLVGPGSVPSVRVGDLSVGAAGDCIAGIPLLGPDFRIPDPAFVASIEGDPNCFSFIELFPGGFTPRFGGELEDKSIAVGLRGELGIGSGLHWDVSYYYGQNDIDFFINNTINASLGPDTPTSFRPGGYSQIDENINLDFSYAIPVGFASDLNVAFGAEHRSETFEIRQGDDASFVLGPLAAPSAGFPSGQGFSSSSNGFGGFTPQSAGEDTQENYAVYLDLEADVTDKLVLQAAVRYEDFYESYGTTTNYKLGALYHITDDFTVRSTWSTGFRVPTAGQANVTNVTTAFDGATLVDQGTIPLSTAAGQFIADRLELDTGVRPTLTPETSENWTIGTGFRLGEINVTIDFFNIDVEDRIAISDQQDFLQALLDFAADEGVVLPPGSDTTAEVLFDLDAAGALEADDFAGSEDLVSFGFFTNSFSTRTRGIDVVATYPFEMMGGESSLALAANWTDTEVTDSGQDTAAPLSPGRLKVLEDGLPAIRGSLTLNHEQGPWRFLARGNYFGEFFECHLDAYDAGSPDGCELPYNGDAQITVDLELGFDVTEHTSIAIGAQNAFDSYPDENPFGGVAGSAYPQYGPAGFNGGFYYVRTRATF
ncbi:TonB-dependent receptor plug domain-containing protein [Terricaulis silvestris]|uniref:Enterobactin outer-membrane receptor n=1 Tax=Terricaulis silvestris TaxID=2686094 RepID=A0A6I6MLC7_9CAUL|nr:TonB-dependent receptor [Terricaulis silvestris]QGZ93986.1 Enterobactin outer-membrane receptor [Terricaulis silvestris]